METTIQPYFSKAAKFKGIQNQLNNQQNQNQVSKEKLTQLWFEDKKKAIEIIKNNNVWPETVHAVVQRKITEQ